MVYKAGKERGPCHESFASDHELPWPEDSPACSSAGSVLCLLYSRWMYSYMNRVLRKGSQQQKSSSHGQANELSPSDLYKVPKRMEASNLSAEFWSTYDSTNRRFLRTLWCLAAPTFIPAGLCQFIAVVAQVSIPLLVRQLLIVVETHPKQSIIKEGLPYAILLFVTSAINALFNHRHHHLSFKSGIIIRSAVADAVYEHALRLSPTGRLGLSTAQITNMVAIDSQKLFEVMQEGHLIWSCPLAILIVSALLLIIIGISSIVGIVALILTLPLVKFVVTKMIQVRGERVKVTDERIEIVTSMLQGIKVTKLNNYEEKFEERVLFSREREMKLVRKEQSIWAWTLVIMLCTPVIATAATFATYVLISEENILTASMTFTTLMLFSALRFPINYGGKLIGKAALGYQAAIRMSGFFTRDVLEPVDFDHYVDKKGSTCEGRSDESEHRLPNLAVTGATFVVGAPIDAKKSELKSKTEASLHLSSTSNACFTLFDISFSVAPSEVLAVVGTVGSGKTSLVKGLIGEIDCTSRNGKAIMRRGRIAYASQTPFILNATVRDNILFGTEFDQARYQKVLDACCLRPDLQQLGPGGEMTEIGERGVTLSGGQKQRISLGRAVYAMPDIAIFDDPLSALDASTSRTIFENLFDESPKYDLLSSSAVVLVTHASHFLHRVNHILFVHGGRQVFHGTFDEMSKFECDDLEAAEVISAMQNTLKEGGETDSRKRSVDASVDDGNDRARLRNSGHESDTCGEIMTIEDREHGLPTLGTWLLWFKYAGGWMFVLIQVLFMVIERTAYVGIEWWLAIWTDAADEPVQVFNKEIPPQTHGISAQYMYLQVYAVLFVIMTIFAVMRSQWAVSGGTRCAKLLFSHMTTSVLRAPMSYFETTPMGRVLNRFTHDVEMVDTTLTQTMTILIISLSWFVASVVVMTAILPWLLAVIVPVVFAYALVLMHYRKSAADLQRLDVMSRSPVQALLAEGLDGAATIRSFGMQRFFVGKFQSSLDSNCTAMLNFISAHRWLAVRIEMLGALVTLAASLLVTLFNDKLGLDPGVVGLLITWSSNFTIVMGFFVDSVSESEAAITSIERIHRMSELPREQSMTTPDENQVDPYWPREGTLQFVGTKLRYRSGLNLALDGLSFTLEHGKRCGVVGRTGAGKSSITAALFRLVEIESGQICLDGVDLASLGLEDVRGRPHCMSIIPQDPVLFAGTLRECLDPFGLSTDEEILDAMRSVQISNAARGVNALNDIVEEGGANFSVGERQLLCLARALLVKPKLLVLDEATASVDDKTDMFIQKLLRRRFCDTTLLTIAHRLNTIMDYDNILVMDGGKAVEFGSPSDLLQIQGGAFSELVDATGAESAAALKLMADKEQMKIFRPCN